MNKHVKLGEKIQEFLIVMIALADLAETERAREFAGGGD
jgi:hypothetical protein